MSNGKVLLGVLAGVAVGATMGILFAPEKGSVTRKKISDKGEDYAEELGDKFNEFMGIISKQFESVKTEALKISENGRVKAEDMITEVSAALK
ncbi:MAG: YtxH domain-containing protein [Bacteroidota bacterium]